MKQIVIMPGGFHPFHAGHASLYQSALKAFPNADVYVAATNDTKTRPFPFAIKEKLAKLAGVAPGHFIQVKSPFKSEEITSHYNPDEDVLIFVRSEKDKTEQPKPGGIKKDGTPAYFQPWTGKNLQPFSKHAYIAYLPTVEFGPGIKSATEIRNAWPTLNDRRKTAMVMSLYPATQSNPKLAANVVKMLDMGMGGQVDEGLVDIVKGIKRKVAGKEDPKEVEHTYGRIARSAIKHKTPDQAEKDIKRWEKVNQVVNKEDVAEDIDIGKEWMSDTELDQYVPERLQQQWRELLGYDMNGNPSALWSNLTGTYEPDVRDPQHRSLMVKVANKWFAAKKILNVKFFDVKDADDELEWLVQIGPQAMAEESDRQFAQRMKKKAEQPPTKGMSQKEKEDKGWAKPKEQSMKEGAPIVVMPRADRLKKAEPPKQRYMGDIVPPTKPPSTEKRGVKGRPGQRPMPDSNVTESADYLDEK